MQNLNFIRNLFIKVCVDFFVGCYVINGNFQHFKIKHSNSPELQCQMLCDAYKFYSIKVIYSLFMFSVNYITVTTNRLPLYSYCAHKRCIYLFSRDTVLKLSKYSKTKYYTLCSNWVNFLNEILLILWGFVFISFNIHMVGCCQIRNTLHNRIAYFHAYDIIIYLMYVRFRNCSYTYIVTQNISYKHASISEIFILNF